MYTSITVANFLFRRHDQHRQAKGNPFILSAMAVVYADWAQRVGQSRWNKKYLLEWVDQEWNAAYWRSQLAPIRLDRVIAASLTHAYQEIKAVIELL